MCSRTQYTYFSMICNLALLCLISLPLSAAEFPGGFLEQQDSNTYRATLTQTQIANFLPQRGKFTFPAPYDTTGVRLTNTGDCGGSDCVNYTGYSYWRNINNHVGEETMLILVGLYKSRGGDGPSLISYNKITDEVVNLGSLFEDGDARSWATGEGWYFSANEPYTVYMTDNARLLRFDVVSRQSETVFDLTQIIGSGYYLWQTHSSADDRVHSATVRDSASYAMLGCIVYREDTQQHAYYPSQGNFDECQIDKSGNWLVIKEDLDGRDGEDNRIINVTTGQERILMDRDGAGGHSDMGYGYMIAADNWANDANTQKLWDFTAPLLEGKTVYHNNNWNIQAPAHLSHSNASGAMPAGQQYACGSSANRINHPHSNEIICFGLDGSTDALVVAPVMTNLNASGGGDDYAKAPKGNLDVTGQYFIWTSNMGGSRLDAFLVKVPSQLLAVTSGSTDGTDPLPTPVPTPQPDPVPDESVTSVVWTDLINASVSGTTLTKTSGCDGCSDAGAASGQQIVSGDTYLEFTVDETQKLRYAGLSVSQQGTGAAQIDFALGLQAGYVEVRENGVYRADIPVNTGDALRISVLGGKVSYARNGTVFYTSMAAPAYPLRGYVTLFSAGSTVSNASLAGATTSEEGTGTTPPTPAEDDTPGTLTATAVTWGSFVKAMVRDTTLTKKGGCDGCSDAGAITGQSISAGKNGYLEFTVDETRKLRYAGLSKQRSGTSTGQIDFALALQAGYVEVRETGMYRADITIKEGDVLRISVQQGQVNYARNGQVFYTSGKASTSNLFGTASLLSSRSTIKDARMATGN